MAGLLHARMFAPTNCSMKTPRAANKGERRLEFPNSGRPDAGRLSLRGGCDRLGGVILSGLFQRRPERSGYPIVNRLNASQERVDGLQVFVRCVAVHRPRHRGQNVARHAHVLSGPNRSDEHVLGPDAEPGVLVGREVGRETDTPGARKGGAGQAAVIIHCADAGRVPVLISNRLGVP